MEGEVTKGLGPSYWLGASSFQSWRKGGSGQQQREATLALPGLPPGLLHLLLPSTSCFPHFHQPDPQQH